MKAAHLGRTILAATSVLLSAGAASAQQPGGAPGRGQRAGIPTQLIGMDGTSVTIDYPGGTLQEFVSALRKSTKDPVNISLQADAPKLHVDPLSLREVSVEAALRAALGTRANGSSMEPDGRLVGTQLEAIQQSPDGKTVLVVTSRAVSAYERSRDSSIEVLSIQSLVRAPEGGAPPVPEQVVLSAIDAGLKLNHVEGDPLTEINYHKDSGLLLIRGQSADLRLVKEIVGSMMQDQQRRTGDARDRKRGEISRRAQIQRTQITLELASRKVEMAKVRLAEVDQLVKAGTASTSELADAQMAMAQAQAEVQMSKVEMDRLSAEGDAGMGGGPEPMGNSGGPAPDVAQLQMELGKALQRIKELEDAAASAPGKKAKNKGE